MGWTEFTKVKKIGEGSFGKAWLVKCNKENKHFVIKEIGISKMPIRERDEARKEVAVLAQMQHPNIVSYINSFEELGSLCIIMDYCDAGDLYARIIAQRGVYFHEEQVLDWFVQITLALKHVHDRKILHRDLKSQNIFLTKDGSVKLGDFGVAKVLANTMELAKTAIGTPYYMSPEICESKPYNNKSDVWSLGCVLYEVLSLKHPFEANDVKNLVLKILRGNFEPIKPTYSYDLRNLVSSMLKRNPKERPSVNGILRKPFIMKRCQRFLTNEKLAEEFSHTILHGENIARKLPAKAPVSRPTSSRVSQSPRPLISNPPASPIQKPYDPSKIYKNPFPVKRPQLPLQKSIEKRATPSKIVLSKPTLNKNVVQRVGTPSSDNRKRTPDPKEEISQFKKQLDSLVEKQKQERIKKAREQGWQNVLSNSTEDKEVPITKDKESLSNNNNPYLRYQEQLDRYKIKNKEPEKGQKLNNNDHVSNEYFNRKADAARNKARDHESNLFYKPPVAPVKKNVQESYLETLNKIRLQNLNRKIDKGYSPVNISNDQESRLKQIAALKKQSEEQAKKLHKELEKRRIDAYEKEQKEWKNHIDEKVNARKVPFPMPIATPLFEPKVIPMTEALGAIGVVNNAKQIKENILKNLNEKESRNFKNENERRNWQQATDLSSLDQKPLVNSIITSNDANKPKVPNSPLRKAWDQPHQTIFNVLDKIELSDTSAVPADAITVRSENIKKINETFVIDKKDADSLIPSNITTTKVNTAEGEKITQSKLDNVNLQEDSMKSIIDLTKSILLGVTFGQYDLKNTKLLRTCSEPDMTKLFQFTQTNKNSELKKTDKSINFGFSKKQTIHKRLVKSTDDLGITNECLTKISTIEVTDSMISELLSDDNDDTAALTLMNSDLDIEEDDMTEVRQTMTKLLNDDSDSENESSDGNEYKSMKHKSPKVKNLASGKQTFDEDSLEDYDAASVTLVLDDSGSDTEFEDDMIYIPKIQTTYSDLEEKREKLEREFGAENFIKLYKAIEAERIRSQSTHELKIDQFKHLLPENKKKLFDEVLQLVIADNEYHT